VHKRWFPDGRLGYIKHHVHGRPEGEHKRWYADGTLRLDATYRNGELHGQFHNWLEDGSVYELATYENGKKVTTTLATSEAPAPGSTAAVSPHQKL
jgi:antitoxin component YwqK of YwqJK toxin-antitoxin module